jgi:hypothetical protein
MQQISFTKPQTKRTQDCQKKPPKKPGSYSAQLWQKTYFPELEEEKE